MNSLEQARELRRKTTGEVFTPQFLAQHGMIPTKLFLNLPAGEGIFVTLAIKKRMEHNITFINIIKNIYAIDIMEDNIEECRKNVLKIFLDYFKEQFDSKQLSSKETNNSLYSNNAS